MAFVIAPSRNPIVQAAWAGLRAADKKASKPEEKPEVGRPKGEKAKPGKGTPTKAEREWLDKIVRYGCVACRIDGLPSEPPAVHHILRGGRRMGHLFTLPLCPGHHQDGTGRPGLIARHPFKQRFEAMYGDEWALLARLKSEIGATR